MENKTNKEYVPSLWGLVLFTLFVAILSWSLGFKKIKKDVKHKIEVTLSEIPKESKTLTESSPVKVEEVKYVDKELLIDFLHENEDKTVSELIDSIEENLDDLKAEVDIEDVDSAELDAYVQEQQELANEMPEIDPWDHM